MVADLLGKPLRALITCAGGVGERTTRGKASEAEYPCLKDGLMCNKLVDLYCFQSDWLPIVKPPHLASSDDAVTAADIIVLFRQSRSPSRSSVLKLINTRSCTISTRRRITGDIKLILSRASSKNRRNKNKK